MSDKTSDLAAGEERRAYERGLEHGNAGTGMNHHWLYRRTAVTEAYRRGYLGAMAANGRAAVEAERNAEMWREFPDAPAPEVES